MKDPGRTPLVPKGHEGWINALAIAPDGRLVTSSVDKMARVWDMKDPAAPPPCPEGA